MIRADDGAIGTLPLERNNSQKWILLTSKGFLNVQFACLLFIFLGSSELLVIRHKSVSELPRIFRG